jgi:hypothetical protein
MLADRSAYWPAVSNTRHTIVFVPVVANACVAELETPSVAGVPSFQVKRYFEIGLLPAEAVHVNVAVWPASGFWGVNESE